MVSFLLLVIFVAAAAVVRLGIVVIAACPFCCCCHSLRHRCCSRLISLLLLSLIVASFLLLFYLIAAVTVLWFGVIFGVVCYFCCGWPCCLLWHCRCWFSFLLQSCCVGRCCCCVFSMYLEEEAPNRRIYMRESFLTAFERKPLIVSDAFRSVPIDVMKSSVVRGKLTRRELVHAGPSGSRTRVEPRSATRDLAQRRCTVSGSAVDRCRVEPRSATRDLALAEVVDTETLDSSDWNVQAVIYGYGTVLGTSGERIKSGESIRVEIFVAREFYGSGDANAKDRGY